jgi:hypothetical protein
MAKRFSSIAMSFLISLSAYSSPALGIAQAAISKNPIRERFLPRGRLLLCGAHCSK